MQNARYKAGRCTRIEPKRAKAREENRAVEVEYPGKSSSRAGFERTMARVRGQILCKRKNSPSGSAGVYMFSQDPRMGNT